METIRYTHHLPPFDSNLINRYFGGLRMGVFDIETLGLNPASSELILAGFLSAAPDGCCHVTQYFAETKAEERNVLLAIQEELDRYNYVLTYNGKHFDLPFTQKRASLLGVDRFHPGCYDLDLYLILHGHSNLKQILPNLKQKTVEDYMGLNPDRKDKISGADSIELYKDFVLAENGQKKENLRKQILLHNHDDLVQLYRILPILLKADLHRAMSYLGFPVAAGGNWPQLNVSKARIDHAGLTITGSYGGPAFSYISYDDGTAPYSCEFTPEGEFQFLVPTTRHGSDQFINLRTLLPESEPAMSRYPGYVNGFLVLYENSRTNFLEVNMFTRALLSHFMKTAGCPI